MINCIIVDDEQHAIDILVNYVGQTPLLHLVGTHTNPLEALQTVAEQPVDLVFLDIQMPELSGIDFINTIRGSAKVIFTTAYSEFALEGYELEVIDYLLKPIRFPRFLSAVQKAVKRIQEGADEATDQTADNYIFVKTGSRGTLLKINLDEIDYIEAMKNYIAIYRGTHKTLVYSSMKDIEEHLPASQFIRVHKSFIVPVQRISGIEGNRILLKGTNVDIAIGENYKDQLMKRISGNLI